MSDLSPDSRLNKHLAFALGVSRREADELITANRVKINGEVAHLGARVTENDTLLVDDEIIAPPTHYTYLLLNKPVGYICSRRRQGDTPTIYELLPPELHALKPVGRLDKDSSGLLLLTDDGDFAHQMTHPSFHKVKRYEVTLDQPLQPLHQQMISDFGVMLDDGKSRFTITRLEKGEKSYEVIMSEGRNRQIRRTFAALGYTVTQLHRTDFGRFALSGTKKGAYQTLDIQQIDTK